MSRHAVTVWEVSAVRRTFRTRWEPRRLGRGQLVWDARLLESSLLELLDDLCLFYLCWKCTHPSSSSPRLPLCQALYLSTWGFTVSKRDLVPPNRVPIWPGVAPGEGSQQLPSNVIRAVLGGVNILPFHFYNPSKFYQHHLRLTSCPMENSL